MHNLKEFFSLIIFIILLGGCANEKPIKVINLAHGLDVNHPVHRAMVFMGEHLREKSNGKMDIAIYPNQQLGSERECIELLQIGSLGMTKVSSAVLENFVEEYKIFGLPYLFNDREHRLKVLNSAIGKKFLNYPLAKRLKGLAFYDAGSRSFYTKTKIEKPEDLSGLKIRVMESQTAIKLVNIMGGAATPIASGELYTALQQGIVDGAENNPPTLYATRQYELSDYYLLDEHTSIPDVLMISKVVWNDLTEIEKGWLQESAEASVAYQNVLWKQAEEEALEHIKNSGVEILKADKDLFRDAVSGIYEDFNKNEKTKKLIDQIQRMK